eukprot:COSAG02_NODE_15519_length_1163_cov_6.037594_2_plen_30_part_01
MQAITRIVKCGTDLTGGDMVISRRHTVGRC